MVDEIMLEAEEHMEKAVSALSENFASVRTGRASAMVLNRIFVDYYGVATPINQMAGIKTPEANLLVIEPWDKSALKGIERAIMESDLGITPSNDGMVIRLAFPTLTEERRIELTKKCRNYAEEARVSVRNARHHANAAIAKEEKDSLISEDDKRRAEADVQKLTDKFIEKIDATLKTKEAEVMEV